jgi:hypothetical protein
MTAVDTNVHETPRLKRPVHRQASGRGTIRISANVSDVIDDPESVADWDDEELRRGRRRDRNGKFTGRDPVVIPTAVYREMVRRATRGAEKKMAENLEAAVDTLVAIASSQSDSTEDKDRINAAKIILDRVMGREPIKLDHSGAPPLFLGIIQAGLVVGGTPVGSLPNGEIIDVESDEVIFE